MRTKKNRMQKLKFTVYVFPVFLALALISCKKPAGEGGKASIQGKIWAQEWNAGYTFLNGEYAGADEDVYIIYGNEINYGDKVTTNYKGEFEFKYLRKGKYKVYVYSKDNTLISASGDTVMVREVEIKERKEKIDLGTITIYKK